MCDNETGKGIISAGCKNDVQHCAHNKDDINQIKATWWNKIYCTQYNVHIMEGIRCNKIYKTKLYWQYAPYIRLGFYINYIIQIYIFTFSVCIESEIEKL